MIDEELHLELRQLQIENRAICNYAEFKLVRENEQYEKLSALLPSEELLNFTKARLESVKAFENLRSALNAGITMRREKLEAEVKKRNGGTA